MTKAYASPARHTRAGHLLESRGAGRVQGALKLILEPIFEADFQPGSFGYRPKKTAHEAIDRVAQAIVQEKTRVIDLDLKSYFDNVRHDRLLAKVAKRVDDDDAMHLLKVMLKANGRYGVRKAG